MRSGRSTASAVHCVVQHCGNVEEASIDGVLGLNA